MKRNRRFIASRYTRTNAIFATIFAVAGSLFAFPDFDKAKIEADQGNAKAQGIVATYYALGWQTAKDLEIAARYAEQSARAGDPLGKFRLGALLRNGEGITKDEALGLRLQNEAAGIWSKGFDENDPFSLTAIGVAVFQGKVLNQDKIKAAQFYKKAADMNFAPAQFNYAMCAKEGQGIQKDPALCAAYLTKAAENGYRLAQEALSQSASSISSTDNPVYSMENRLPAGPAKNNPSNLQQAPSNGGNTIIPFADWLKSIQRKSQDGDPDSIGIEADLIADGIIRKPFENCLIMAKNSSAKGSPFGDYALACIYLYRTQDLDSLNISERLTESQSNSLIANSVPKFEALAGSGNQYAKIVLGYIYGSGQGGVATNTKKAVGYLKEAASSNFPLADYVLSDMYKNGKGVIEDKEFAEELFERALKNGHPTAMRTKGFELINTGTKNYNSYYFKEGISILEKCIYNYQDAYLADELGNFIIENSPYSRLSLYNSDNSNENERLTVDSKYGLKFMELSADYGSIKNQILIAEAYLEKNPKLAFKYARLATESQSSRGALVLGRLYEDKKYGLGGDTKKAAESYYKAITYETETDQVSKQARVDAAKYLQRLGEDELLQKALDIKANREKLVNEEKEKQLALEEERKQEEIAKNIGEIKSAILRYQQSVKDSKSLIDSGPDKDTIIQAMWPLCQMMEKQFKNKEFEIQRGSPLISQGYKDIPVGVEMYPIRLGGSHLQFTFYFYQDEFNNWKAVEK